MHEKPVSHLIPGPLEAGCSYIGSVVPLGYLVPVDNVEEGRYIVGSSVLIVQVIGMLPDIEPEDGSALMIGNIHQRIVLVGSGSDEQLIVSIYTQPGPT